MEPGQAEKVQGIIVMLEKGIREQKAKMRAAGFAPDWGLFSHSFGWYQIKKWAVKNGLSESAFESLYKDLWGKVN